MYIGKAWKGWTNQRCKVLWFGNVPDLKLNTTKPTAMEKLGIFESVHPYSQYVEMLSKGSWVS